MLFSQVSEEAGELVARIKHADFGVVRLLVDTVFDSVATGMNGEKKLEKN